MSHTAILTSLVALAFVVTGGLFGKTMVEKLLTELVMPSGLVWLMLIAVTYGTLVSRQRFMGTIALICLVAFTTFGNQYVSNTLIQSLEQPYIDQPPVEPGDVDVVVVLGGGTLTDLRGRAQLGTSGDRVAAAAQLYHASVKRSQALRIICTGEQVYRADPSDLDPREEARNCLVALGVAEEDVSTIGGANTYEEMQHLKEWIDQQPTGTQVGILTSAWHLPRAMRLAEARGIKAKPVPSDFKSYALAPSVGMVVPTSGCLFISTLGIKEYLARLVKR